MTKKIQLIIGSTREGRIASTLATWVESQVAKNEAIELEIIDLKEVDLPFFNDAISPANGPPSTDAGKAWAEIIGRANGYIFITPEYNGGYPAALKNAIDYLYAEWINKPAAVVSYGWTDGGTGVDKQLREVLTHLKMSVADESITIHIKPDMLNEDHSFKDTAVIFAEYEEGLQTALTQLVTAEETEAVTV